MKVLITRDIPQAGIDILKKFPQIEIDHRQGAPLSTEEMKKAIKGVDGIIPVIPDKITKEVLEAAGPSLKIVAHYAVGYDNIDVEAATGLGIYVSNTPGDLTESVAEHAFALMMSAGKRVVEADTFCRKGDYHYWDPMIFLGPKFKGKKLGVVGFGRIGQHFAKMCKFGLDMDILYFDSKQCVEAEKELGAKKAELEELLNNSDVISLHVNLTENTRHLIGEKQLRMMKPDAIIINTARGPVINEEALAVALKEKWIEGAGLDVFEKEPQIHPDLVKLPNVVLTPHIGSATREARIQMARMAAENIVEVLINRKPPVNLVNTDLASEKSAPTVRLFKEESFVEKDSDAISSLL
jgi:glyoxylate reductase